MASVAAMQASHASGFARYMRRREFPTLPRASGRRDVLQAHAGAFAQSMGWGKATRAGGRQHGAVGYLAAVASRSRVNGVLRIQSVRREGHEPCV
jgi:hypothetical protein